MLNEKQIKFVELYSNKGKSGMTNSTIATELKIDQATIYRWLKNEEVKKAINKECANSIDSMLPQLINNAESMLCSSNANEKAKGTDIALKLMDKVKLQNELTVMDREKILIEHFINKCVESSLFMRDISQKMFLEVCIGGFIDKILLKGYEKSPMTAWELDKVIKNAVDMKKMMDNDVLHNGTVEE